jgi:hypothetical protein
MKAVVWVVLVASCGSAQKSQPIANTEPPPPAPIVRKTRMQAMRDDVCACKDVPCIEAVAKRYAAQAEGQHDTTPTEEDMRLAQQTSECMQKISATAAPAPVVYSSGVAECDRVVARYELLFTCDAFQQLPAEAIRAQRDSLDAMKQTWEQLRDAPPEAKQAAATGCTAALDALAQAAKALGCSL